MTDPDVWTSREEEKFQQDSKRRALVLARRRQKLAVLFKHQDGCRLEWTVDTIFELLIRNANDFIDALEPFKKNQPDVASH